MPAGGLISVSYNEFFQLPGVTPTGLDWDPGPLTLADTEALVSGAFDVNLPTSPNPYPAAAAGMEASYFDDYYNRIHFTPNRLDLGAITALTSRSIDVWNAYVDLQVILSAIEVDTAAGLSFSPAAPITFAPLQNHTFTMEASVDGIPVLDVSVPWVFDVPYTYLFDVTGNRAKEWPLDPNWAQSYRVNYAFQTEVLTSRSGREQRIALRTTPRRRVEYQSTATGPKFNQAKNLLWLWQDRTFVIPELPRFVSSTADATAGSLSLPVDAVPTWLTPGSPVMLSYSGMRALAAVDSAVLGTVTFTSPLGSAWPAGTKLHPALSGYLAATTQVDRLTNTIASVATRFAVVPLSEPWIEPPAAETVFNGREVFLKRPNWAQDVKVTAEHEVDQIDYDRGPVFRYSPVEFGTEGRRALYLNRDAVQAQALVDFFYRMRGRQGEFYMPSWEYDFQPKEAVLTTGSAMRIAGSELAEVYGASTVHKALFVMLLDGSLLFKKVVSVQPVVDGDTIDSVITIDGTWGTAFNVDTIVMCGWMPAWRLSSDEITLEWITSSVAQTQLTMQTLEDLAV